MNKKGQPRHGGKPLGWRKPEGIRKQRQLRAYDDEWELIQQFAKTVKHGDKKLCQDFINYLNEKPASDAD